MAIVFIFITVWLFTSQVEQCKGKSIRDILPEYIEQIMDRVIQPIFLKLIKLRQMKVIANEKNATKVSDEHCEVLFDELELEAPYLKQAYNVVSKLAGYLSLYSVEAKKCESDVPVKALQCFVHVGKNVADVYSIYEGTTGHLLDELQEIDTYVTHLLETCFIEHEEDERLN